MFLHSTMCHSILFHLWMLFCGLIKYVPGLLNKVLSEKIVAFLGRRIRCDQLEILRELADYYPSDACILK